MFQNVGQFTIFSPEPAEGETKTKKPEVIQNRPGSPSSFISSKFRSVRRARRWVNQVRHLIESVPNALPTDIEHLLAA